MVAVLAVSALTIVAWTQPWFSLTLVDDELDAAVIEVAGDVAAQGLAGLGLAGLALVGALSIAGRVIRVVLGALGTVLGAVVAVSALSAVADPVAASAATITESTGIAGSESTAGVVASVSVGFWPYAAVVLGVSSAILGVLIVATSRQWPGSSSKFAAVPPGDDARHAVATPATERADAGAPAGSADPVADWDALSDGADPTAR